MKIYYNLEDYDFCMDTPYSMLDPIIRNLNKVCHNLIYKEKNNLVIEIVGGGIYFLSNESPINEKELLDDVKKVEHKIMRYKKIAKVFVCL